MDGWTEQNRLQPTPEALAAFPWLRWNSRFMIIAIDGPAASGKGTLARRIAKRLGFAHLDTGSLYRAVGLSVLRAGGDPSNEDDAVRAALALNPSDAATLNDPGLRAEEAADAASKVAVIPLVRQALLDFQRRFARLPPDGALGSVLDGRDIGTNVCPDADAKLFITASTEVRAQRRVKELQGRSLPAIYEDVLADMKNRDMRDSLRAVSPLRPADDAFVLDTSELDADQAYAAALAYIGSKTGLDTAFGKDV